jgi:hypothetical protein
MLVGVCREQALAHDTLGRHRLKGPPSSRTGENPPYGMIGGDRGDVGIIRSPVRASILPDCPLHKFPLDAILGGKGRSLRDNNKSRADVSPVWRRLGALVTLFGPGTARNGAGIPHFRTVARIINTNIARRESWQESTGWSLRRDPSPPLKSASGPFKGDRSARGCRARPGGCVEG